MNLLLAAALYARDLVIADFQTSSLPDFQTSRLPDLCSVVFNERNMSILAQNIIFNKFNLASV